MVLINVKIVIKYYQMNNLWHKIYNYNFKKNLIINYKTKNIAKNNNNKRSKFVMKIKYKKL
jgi:hypothetical protein